MFRKGVLLSLLCSTQCQPQSAFFGVHPVAVSVSSKTSQDEMQLCTSSSAICYRDNIRLCVGNQPLSASALILTCANGCSSCDSGPDLCNDDQGESRCNVAKHQARALQAKAKAKAKGKVGKAKGKSPATGAAVTGAPATGAPAAPVPAVSTASGPTSSVGASNCNGADLSKRVRVEWSAMPDADRERYVNAVLALYASGDIQKFAQMHYDNRDMIHGNGVLHFVIWHRVFVNDFEEKLRALPGYECVTVPYWTYDASSQSDDRRSLFGTAASKLGQADHAGCIDGAFSRVTHSLVDSQVAAAPQATSPGMSPPAMAPGMPPQGGNGNATSAASPTNPTTPGCIVRQPGMALLASLSGAVFTDLIQLSEPNFPTFSDLLQNTHGLPHVAIGGQMSTHYSPIDPAFFVHHSNIDRLWSIWQDCHRNYEWFEPLGLQQPVIAYPGVTAGDFIDNSKYVWKGKTQAVEYSSDALGSPEQYSSDFRQRIATSCQGGGLTRTESPAQVAPVIGVDDSWATRAGSIISGGITPLAIRTVPLTCVADTGIMDLTALPNEPLAIYNELSFQSCVSRCGTFYFKNNGMSNCACITRNAGRNSASTLDVAVSQYTPSCGAGTTYGLFQPAGASGRRLLQTMQQQPRMSMAPPQPGVAVPPANTVPLGSSSTMGGSTNAMGGSTMGSTTPSSTSSTSMGGGSSVSANAPVAAGTLPRRPNAGGKGITAQPPLMATLPLIGLANSTASNATAPSWNATAPSWNATAPSWNATSPSWNATAPSWNATVNATAPSWNATAPSWNATMNATAPSWNTTLQQNSSFFTIDPTSTRVCFNAFAPSGPTVERACSSGASTPPPLPIEWMRMNNLSPENADTCKLFKPAQGTKAFDCVQNFS